MAAAAPPRHAAVRSLGLLVSAAILLLVALASIAIGAKELSLAQVWHGLFQDSGTYGDTVVGERLSRTVLGLLAGAALGLAGAVLQELTRNPLADPGILGINAGASAAVVTAITFLGVTSLSGYVWFAFLGAAAVGALVWFLGGSQSATPVRLALAGTAISAALYGYLQAVMITDGAALGRMRLWTVGSLASATDATVAQVLPFFAVGTVVALLLARPLNAMAMGDDTARALGADLNRTRALAMLAATVLCGASTAACGPIVFVGLMIPHVVRSFTGPDLRWILPYAALLSPVLLVAAAAGPVGFVALTAPQLARRLTLSPGPNLLPSLCMGAALLVTADWSAQRALGADQLPVGVVTGVLGGVYLLWLLVTERRAGRI